MFRKLLDFAEAGDNIGVLLRGIQRTDIERGQVLAKPGTIHPHTKFKGQVYVLTKDEGGRHTPFFNNYRPQFYFRTTDVTGVISLPEGTEMCMPGDNVVMDVEPVSYTHLDVYKRQAPTTHEEEREEDFQPEEEDLFQEDLEDENLSTEDAEEEPELEEPQQAGA